MTDIAGQSGSGGEGASRYRVQPTARLAIVFAIGYTLLITGVSALSGVPYDELADSAENVWRGPVTSLAVGSVVLVAFVAWARWDIMWRDPARLPMTRLSWVLLGTFSVTIVVRVVGTSWGDIDGALLAGILTLGVLVGLSEELLFRGVFLRCMRSSVSSEAMAAIWTTVAFGLFHLPNVFIGAGPAGLLQVVLAGLSGVALYYFRRSFGLIVVAMVAHGLFDASLFAAGDYSSDGAANLAAALNVLIYLLGAAAGIQLFRRNRDLRVTPTGIA